MKEVTGGEFILYRGEIARVLGYSPRGEKCVIIEPLTNDGKDKCPHCAGVLPTQIHVNEGCLNWQEDVKPVPTL